MPLSQKAQRYFRTLASEYADDGYPPIWDVCLVPDDRAEERIMCELTALGLLRQHTPESWTLTEAGLARIMA